MLEWLLWLIVIIVVNVYEESTKYCCVLNVLHVLSHLILRTVLWSRCYHFHHFNHPWASFVVYKMKKIISTLQNFVLNENSKCKGPSKDYVHSRCVTDESSFPSVQEVTPINTNYIIWRFCLVSNNLEFPDTAPSRWIVMIILSDRKVWYHLFMRLG